MFDLKNTKLAAIDFDGTLCVHQYYGSHMDAVAIPQILRGTFDFQGSQPSVYMARMLHAFQLNGTMCGLLSSTPMHVVVEAKYQWTLRNYNLTATNFSNWCVGTADQKVAMLELLAQTYGFEKHQVLLVDDTWPALAEAQAHGFMACTPSEVVNYFVQLDRE